MFEPMKSPSWLNPMETLAIRQIKSKKTKQPWKHRLKLVKSPSFADDFHLHFPSFSQFRCSKKTPCLMAEKRRQIEVMPHFDPRTANNLASATGISYDGGLFYYVWSIRQEIGTHENSRYLVGFCSGSWIFRICSGYFQDPNGSSAKTAQLMLTWLGSMDVNWEFVSGPWNIGYWNFEFSPMVGVWSDSLDDRGPAVRDKRDPGEHGTRIEMRKVEDSWRFVSGS